MQNTRGASLNDAQDSQSAAEGPGGFPRPRRIGVLIAVALTALTLDAITKVLVVARLEGRTPIELLDGLLTLRVTRNSGAAFSIGTGLTIVFTTIALGVVVAILRTARNLRSLPWAISLGLLLGGATGNLTDRLLRAPSPMEGHVVDWIELPYFPVFNVADSAIVCGGILAVLLAGRGLQLDGTRVGDTDAGDSADDADATKDAAGNAAEGGAGDATRDAAGDAAGNAVEGGAGDAAADRGADKERRKEP
ncbi:signal peptidase II [Thermomonospora echinospora]|uniref:Lipoprotein signal peptidase n=1 Tax=Thermomonospora echinospora TaxID=1992 RepID=A0A1H5SM98_9ACTN|nr:signal peptidase II [Thermomonospora echinospora]SEF51743.1 signal peptidase II [Thermomonospora echinospora]